MKLQTKIKIRLRPELIQRPRASHVVQFYSSEESLLAPLTTYLAKGLKRGDSCVIIATEQHLADLYERLQLKGIDVPAAHADKQLMTFDAAETLGKFMVKGLPDRNLFMEVIGEVIQKSLNRGRPVLTYGEMVALLWKDGNKDAVVALEKLWNDLLESHPISLYCAYPKLHFIGDPEVLEEIQSTHSVTIHRTA